MKLATTAISLLSFGAFSKVVQATCADQAVFENCLQSGKVALAACTYSDWSCKCAAEKVIHTCYNDCSDDPELVAEAEVQEGIVTTYCSLAERSNKDSVSSSLSKHGSSSSSRSLHTPTSLIKPASIASPIPSSERSHESSSSSHTPTSQPKSIKPSHESNDGSYLRPGYLLSGMIAMIVYTLSV